MSEVDTYLGKNERYAARFLFSRGRLPASPADRTAIITCMDARLVPEAALGLREGDAHVIRNAGGAVTEDVIRSLAISQTILGTREVMVIHHTDCGMLKASDDELKDAIESKTGARPPFAMETFPDLEGDVRQSIARIEASPLLMHKDAIRGFVYEVETGRLREVH
jgi:carbonic anhydrase